MSESNSLDFVVDMETRQERPQPPPVLDELVALADVRFNGDRPWDMQVNDAETYRRILTSGSLGLGESYMDGQWDCLQLDVLFDRLLRAGLDTRIYGLMKARLLFTGAATYLRNLLLNRQTQRRAFEVGEQHYDIGNDIYRAMLDSTMSYSCGYWAEADDLAAAQQAKLDLICRKLELQPGEQLLDIGCGWGGLAQHAAKHYGVRVTGVTVSKEQRSLALERCDGLPVDIALMDYRDIEGSFDKVVSVGMFEHVGPKNYRTYFNKVRELLSPEGLFLLHTIGEYQTTNKDDPWIDKYIFPNGKLPSSRRMARGFEGMFTLQDWHNFGPDYDLTLMAWWENFDMAWPELEKKGYDERFYRMWKYYLHSCAGYFRSGNGQLWQMVFSPLGRHETYRSLR